MKSLSRSKFYQRSRRIHIENKGLKLLSLGLAILLFAVSRQPISNVHLRGVSIEYRGLKSGVEIVSAPEQIESADILLRGPRDVVRSLTPSQLAVIADLTNKELGERIVQLNADDSALPENTKIIGIEPSNIKIKLERTIRKTVRIEPQFIGHVAQGVEIYNVSIEPKEIEIEGPQSLVDKTTFVTTESVSLSERRESFRTSVEVETPNNSLRFKSLTTVTLSVEIGIPRAYRISSEIVAQTFDPPPGGRLSTKTAVSELFGPESLIRFLPREDLILR
jgi:YbbR-like protein